MTIDLLGIANLGELALFRTPRDVAKACGAFLQGYQQAAFAAACNRLSPSPEYPINCQDPSALLSEFSLPQDARMLKAKWLHAQDRYTKTGLARMLSAIGVNNWSIYNKNGRVDSVDYGYGSLLDYPPSRPAALTKYAFDKTVDWWTLVVWDNTFSKTQFISNGLSNGTVLGKYPLLASDGGKQHWQLQSDFTRMVVDMCRFNTSHGEYCNDVAFAWWSFPNVGISAINASLLLVNPSDDSLTVVEVDHRYSHQ
jgi:hypothetical protein